MFNTKQNIKVHTAYTKKKKKNKKEEEWEINIYKKLRNNKMSKISLSMREIHI